MLDGVVVKGQRCRGPVLWALVAALLVPAPARAMDAVEAKKIFNQRCTGCHTYGRGVKVGPDLKGVTARRPRAWLLQFIRSSQSMVRARDSVASGLFEQFRREKMPDWTDLSEGQIDSLLEWISHDGPDQREADERDAELATPAEVERGRQLFRGSLPLSKGRVACSSCHSIRDEGQTIGASLGPDLTAAFLKYRDRALTLFLRQPCYHHGPDSMPGRYLVPEDSFALKAYLRRAVSSTEVNR